MAANNFTIDGESVATSEEFLVRVRNDECSHLIYQPEELSGSETSPMKLTNKVFHATSFRKTKIANVNFVNCRFTDCVLAGSQLESCEFIHCIFEGTNTHKIKISNCQIDPKQFANNFNLKTDANIAVDLYQELYKNAVREHQPDHANEALYRMKLAKSRQRDWRYKNGELGLFKYWFAKSADFISRLAWGYGLRLSNILYTTIASFFFFAVLNYIFRTRMFKDGTVETLLDSLYFTCITITTVGYGDIHPVTTFGKSIVIFEAIVGYVLMSLFIATAAKRLLDNR